MLKVKSCFLQLDPNCDLSITDANGDRALTSQNLLGIKRVFQQLAGVCSLTCARGGIPDTRPACVP